MIDETKRCPYCAEEINKDAIKCKHCGEFLTNDIRKDATPKRKGNSKLIAFLIVVGIIIVCFFAGITYKNRINSNQENSEETATIEKPIAKEDNSISTNIIGEFISDPALGMIITYKFYTGGIGSGTFNFGNGNLPESSFKYSISGKSITIIPNKNSNSSVFGAGSYTIRSFDSRLNTFDLITEKGEVLLSMKRINY